MFEDTPENAKLLQTIHDMEASLGGVDDSAGAASVPTGTLTAPATDIGSNPLLDVQVSEGKFERIRELPVGPLQLNMAQLGEVETHIDSAFGLDENGKRTRFTLGEDTAERIEAIREDPLSPPGSQKRMLDYFALFTSRPTDALTLSMEKIKQWQGTDSLLQGIQSNAVGSFIWNNPQGTNKVFKIMFPGSKNARAAYKELEAQNVNKAEDGFLKAVKQFVGEEGSSRTEVQEVFSSRVNKLTSNSEGAPTLIERYRNRISGSDDILEYLNDSIKRDNSVLSTNIGAQAQADLLDFEKQKAEERITLGMYQVDEKIEDFGNTLLGGLLLINEPGRIERGEIANYLKTKGMLSTHDEIPDRQAVEEFREILTGIPRKEFALKVLPELDFKKPLVPQIVEFSKAFAKNVQTTGEAKKDLFINYGLDLATDPVVQVPAIIGAVGGGPLGGLVGTFIGAMIKAVGIGAKTFSRFWKAGGKQRQAIKKMIFPTVANAEQEKKILTVANEFADELEKQTARRSTAQVAQEAEELLSTGTITEKNIPGALNPNTAIADSQIQAVLKIQAQKGDDFQAAVKAHQLNPTPVTFTEAMDAFVVYRSVAPGSRGVGATSGRAVRQFSDEAMGAEVAANKQFAQEMEEAILQGTVDPQAMMHRIGIMETRAQKLKYAQSSREPNWWNKHFEFYSNALLFSAENILIRNPVSMLGTLLYHDVKKIAGATPFIRANTYTEAAHEMMGQLRSFKYAMRMGAKAWKTERPSFGGLTKTDLNMHRYIGIKEETVASGEIVERVGALGRILRTSQRLIAAEDEVVKGVVRFGQVEAEGAKLSALGKLPKGHTIKTYTKHVLENPDQYNRLISKANRVGAKITFTDAPGQFGMALKKLTLEHPSLRLIQPYVGSPISIFKQSFGDATGLNRARDLFMGRILGTNATISKEAQAEFLAFTGVAAGVQMALFDDSDDSRVKVTGSGPVDPIARQRQEELTGLKFNSIALDVDGNGKYDVTVRYPTDNPAGVFLNLMANINASSAYMDNDQYTQFAAAMTLYTGQLLNDSVWYSGMADLVDFTASFRAGDTNQVERILGRKVASLFGTGFTDEIERLVDPVMRDTSTLWNNFASRVPGLSDDVPVEYTHSGSPYFGVGPVTSVTNYPSVYIDMARFLQLKAAAIFPQTTPSFKQNEMWMKEYEYAFEQDWVPSEIRLKGHSFNKQNIEITPFARSELQQRMAPHHFIIHLALREDEVKGETYRSKFSSLASTRRTALLNEIIEEHGQKKTFSVIPEFTLGTPGQRELQQGKPKVQALEAVIQTR